LDPSSYDEKNFGVFLCPTVYMSPLCHKNRCQIVQNTVRTYITRIITVDFLETVKKN